MSNYVNPTGPGYQGVHVVSAGYGVTLSVGMFDVDWQDGTEVYVVFEDDGVALFASDRAPPSYVRMLSVSKAAGAQGPSLTLSGTDLAPLEVDPGDDVRVYKREAGGLLLVARADDPFVEVDDG